MSGIIEEVKQFKRTRIIETAAKLFFERGYETTSVDLLASELGVSKPFVYSYFENKRAILEAMQEESAQRILDYIDQTYEMEGGTKVALAEFIRLFALENIQNQILSGVFLQEEKHLSPEMLERIRTIERVVTQKVASLIQQGIEGGEFLDVDPTIASMSICGMIRWVHRWYRPDGRFSPDEIAHEMSRLGLNMVLVRPRSSKIPQ